MSFFNEIKVLINENNTKQLETYVNGALAQIDVKTFFNRAVDQQDVDTVILGLELLLKHCSDKELMLNIMKQVVESFQKVDFITEKQKLDLSCSIFFYLPSLRAVMMGNFIEYLIEISNNPDQLARYELLLSRSLELALQAKENLLMPYKSVSMLVTDFYRCAIKTMLERLLVPKNIITMAKFMEDLRLTNEEKFYFLNNVCDKLEKLNPNDLSVLSHHIFRITKSGRLVLGFLMAMNVYFTTKYSIPDGHNSLSSQTTTASFNSWTTQTMLTNCKNNQETILLNLQKIAQHIVTENEVKRALDPLIFHPTLVLSSFMFENLVAMTKMNQAKGVITKIAKSKVLRVLKDAILNNNYEILMKQQSCYLNNAFQNFETIDVGAMIKNILEDSFNGLRLVTNGLFGLPFVLLKVKKAEDLHQIACHFLTQFFEKKRLYGRFVMRFLIKFCINHSNSQVFKEAFLRLSTTHHAIIAEHLELYKFLFKAVLMEKMAKALDTLPAIMPLIRSSPFVRDEFIQMLRKAFLKNKTESVKVAIYGSCLLLKQLKYSTVMNPTQNYFFSHNVKQTLAQVNVLNMQTQIDRTRSTTKDRLVSEILSSLTPFLNGKVEIKEWLYKGLIHAVALNSKISSYVTDFILPKFKKHYVIEPNSKLVFDMNSIASLNNDTLIIKENLGLLCSVLVYCAQNQDLTELNETFENMSTLVLNINIDQIGCVEPSIINNIVIVQFCNIIEALMAYEILKSKQSAHLSPKVFLLFEHMTQSLSNYQGLRKVKIDGKPQRKIKFAKNVSILDFDTIVEALKILFAHNETTDTTDEIQSYQQNEDLKMFLVAEFILRLNELKNPVNYLQRKYSAKTYSGLRDCSNVMLKYIQKTLIGTNATYSNELSLALLNVFKHLLYTAKHMLNRKIPDYLANLTGASFENEQANLLIEPFIEIIKKHMNHEEYREGENETKMISLSLEIIDAVLPYVHADSPYCLPFYNVIFDFCTNKYVNAKSLGIIYKVLFVLREKALPPAEFYIKVAMNCVVEFGAIDEEEPIGGLPLESLTISTRDSFVKHFFEALHAQADSILYLVKKAKSYLTIRTQYPGKVGFDLEPMKRIETVIIITLTNLCKVATIVTNAALKIGPHLNSLWRFLIKFYTGLFRLSVHIIQRWKDDDSINFKDLKYEKLLSLTRPLTKTINNLILYVDRTSTSEILKSKASAEAKGRKVLRDAKYLPNLVFYQEKFSVTVIALSRKCKNDLDKRIHLGIYRDFRINNVELQKVLEAQVSRVQNENIDFDKESDCEDDSHDETDSETESEGNG